jgi:glycosyltransferase involved in cell wall biosynthesis
MGVSRERVPVCVIIPCYQSEATLPRALDSVLKQSRLPEELILVDDGSTDGTPEILENLRHEHGSWTKILRNDSNQGPGKSRNRAWMEASQEYLAFLDADDSWHPRKLELHYEFMRSHPGVLMSGHRHLVHEGASAPIISIPAALPVSYPAPWQLLLKNYFTTSGVMLKREVRHRFLETRRASEDYFLWLQIAFSHARIADIQLPLAMLHKAEWGAGGLSSRLWAMEKGELENYWLLKQQGKLSTPLAAVVSAFSLAKFARRVALTPLIRLRARSGSTPAP